MAGRASVTPPGRGALLRALGNGLPVAAKTLTIGRMDEKETPRRHRWPWLALILFLLGVIAAILWMSYAVHEVRQERQFNAPGRPAH